MLSTIIKSIFEKISIKAILTSLAHVVKILLFLLLFTFDIDTITQRQLLYIKTLFDA